MLDSAVGGAFMTKTVNEAKAILKNMLQNFSQWHTERAPSSNGKMNSVEEVDSLNAKLSIHISLNQMLIMSHYKIWLRIILKI
jgi:hypothetical protein